MGVKNKMATNTIKFSKDQINVPTKNVKTENVSKIVLTPQNIKLKLKIEPSKENKKIELSKENKKKENNKNKLDTIRFRKDEINVPTKNVKTENVSKIVLTPQNIKLKLKVLKG